MYSFHVVGCYAQLGQSESRSKNSHSVWRQSRKPGCLAVIDSVPYHFLNPKYIAVKSVHCQVTSMPVENTRRYLWRPRQDERVIDGYAEPNSPGCTALDVLDGRHFSLRRTLREAAYTGLPRTFGLHCDGFWRIHHLDDDRKCSSSRDCASYYLASARGIPVAIHLIKKGKTSRRRSEFREISNVEIQDIFLLGLPSFCDHCHLFDFRYS